MSGWSKIGAGRWSGRRSVELGEVRRVAGWRSKASIEEVLRPPTLRAARIRESFSHRSIESDDES